MKKTDFKRLTGKKIGFLGLGAENLALINLLIKKGIECEMVICDSRGKNELGKRWKELEKTGKVKWKLGGNCKSLEWLDVILRSPGWPLGEERIRKAIKAGVEISSPMKLWLELCPTKNVIGVTGTKGKGTTSSLIAHILKKAGKKVWLGGNIGVAPWEFADKVKAGDWVVLELSSFQLEDIQKSPHIAVMTNFTKEHLAPADPNNPNFHKTLTSYWQAKNNILRWQGKDDFAVLNVKMLNSKWLGGGKKVWFGKSEVKSKLLGEHNKENIAAALEVAKLAGVEKRIAEKAILSFKGLPMRVEKIRKVNGVTWIDDSFATTPESTQIALKSFEGGVILMLGGADKGADFRELCKDVVLKQVKFVVLLEGESTPRIEKNLREAGLGEGKMQEVASMKEGVKLAAKKAEAGDTVLMSTACASFGMFQNYKERGKQFDEAVMKIREKKNPA